jgi:anthranilate phosphoribosyltransferase
MDAKPFLHRLIHGESLTEQESSTLFGALLGGELDEPTMSAILALLAARGPTVDELTGAARVMRAHVTRVPFTPGADERLIDTCGTGGAPKTFNVSTAAAIIAASAQGKVRVVVAKHGNRSRTGRGSAEVLMGLGVRVDATPQVQARCLQEAGVCFCFAIHHHPAMRHAAAVRKALGVPTIFNALGPLTNPAGADRQLIGVYDEKLVDLLAHTLVRLGAARAMVVHGLDGLDELTTTTKTHTAWVTDGQVQRVLVNAAVLGVDRASLASLGVDSLEESVAAVRGVLSVDADHTLSPKREIAVLNAAAALVVGEAAASLEEGMAQAREAIDSGRAARTLETLVKVSHSQS